MAHSQVYNFTHNSDYKLCAFYLNVYLQVLESLRQTVLEGTASKCHIY